MGSSLQQVPSRPSAILPTKPVFDECIGLCATVGDCICREVALPYEPRKTKAACAGTSRQPEAAQHDNGELTMRAMRAETFSGYDALKLAEVPKPTISDGRVLVKITSIGVNPLDYTILSGKFSRASAPLVLGNEGTGVVIDGGGTDFPVNSRVMFTGPYGVS